MAREMHEDFLPEDIKKKLEEEKEAFKRFVEEEIEKVGAIIKHLAEHAKKLNEMKDAEEFKLPIQDQKFEEIKIKKISKEEEE
jgi:hypothetical protein